MDLWAPAGQTSQEWDSGISAEATTAQNILGSGPERGGVHLEGRENQVGQYCAETRQGPLECYLVWQCGSHCHSLLQQDRKEARGNELL